MTTLALGVAGAVVGGAIGATFGMPMLGASIGWSLGSALGSALDPQKVQGPRLNDLKLQVSSYGAAEPIFWGTVRIAGNVIWQTDLVEHSHTTSGKGGGPKVTTYSYSASADTLIAQSPENPQLIKLWADGRLIYGPGATDGVPVTWYDGNDAQLPDPTEEAVTGVGLTPAYRNVCREMFTDWDLTEFGNRIPQLESLVCSTSTSYGPIRLVKENIHTGVDPWAQKQVIGAWVTDLGDETPLDEPSTVTDSPSNIVQGGGGQKWNKTDGIVFADGSELPLWCNPYIVVTDEPLRMPAVSSSSISGDYAGVGYGTNFAFAAGIPAGTYVTGISCTQTRRTVYFFTNTTGGAGHNADIWYRIEGETSSDFGVVDQGTISPGVSGLMLGTGTFVCNWAGGYTGSYQGVSVVEPNREYLWNYYGIAALMPVGEVWFTSLQVFRFDPVSGNFAHDVTSYWGHPQPDNGAFPSIWCFGDGYVGTIATSQAPGEDPHYSQTALWSRSQGSTDVPLSVVVGDICEMCGLTSAQYDVSQLTDLVDGFVISQQMTGRAAIEALMPIYFFDAVESDGRVKFVKRGQGQTFEVDEDDLAAHEDGAQLPAQLSFVRQQEVDLPSSISVVYPNRDADYLLGTQTARRMATASEQTATVQTTAVLTDEHAKQIADALLFNAWVERDVYTFYTTRKYVQYEPTDVAIFPGLRLRIESKSESDSGVIKWTGRPCYDPVFAQAGVGGPSAGFVPPVVTPPQTTDLILLDIPLLTEWVNQSSYRPAMAGHDRASWKGASLMKSIDGGTNYSEVIVSTQPDTIGVASDGLAWYGGGNTVDELSAVTVVIANGATLESTTADGLLNGVNEAVLGRELLQFRDATLTATDTYVLTGLLRGRRGTEWAMASHAAGDNFVLLPTAREVAAVSGEYGIERQYKAVTLGSTVDTATAQTFAVRGVSVTPLSPVHPAAGIDGDGNWILMWTRRARMNAAFLNFVDVPLDEASERYIVRFFTDRTFTIEAATYDCTASTFTFTIAQQTAVYGSPQTDEPPWTVAQYGAAGPGYDTLGRSPVVVAPPATTPPPVTPDVPLGDVQWHADYRYPDTTHANKNFNWLQDNYSSSWAWCYMYWAVHTQLSNDLVFDLGVEGNRIINTMGGMGYYAPAGFMVPLIATINVGPTLHAEHPDVDIPLPYPNDDA